MKHIIALEIGSSAIKLGAATVSAPARGARPEVMVNAGIRLPLDEQVRHGRIFNLNATAEVIARGISELEASPAMKGHRVTGVYVAVGGRSLATTTASARISMPEFGEIDSTVIDRLHEEACASVPETKEILQVIPLRYEVDGQPTANPLGSTGQHIAASFTIVHCDPRNITNIETVVNERLNLDICDWVIRPLAIADICLTEQEKHAGCMLADIGDQTTTVSIFKDDKLRYIATIPLGSRLITTDIATGMGITNARAENLKLSRGNAVSESMAASTEQIKLDNIVQARAAEIVANISAYIEFAGMRNADLPAGIILTGGGSKLRNIGLMLSNTSRLKVRQATALPAMAITDTTINAGDDLDLLALINRAAEIIAIGQATQSVTDDGESIYPPEAPASHAGQQPQKHAGHRGGTSTESSMADVNNPVAPDESRDALEFEHLDFEDNDWESSATNNFGYSDFNGSERDENTGADPKFDDTDGFDIDEDDDPYLLEDDDRAEALRRSDENKKAAARDKIRRQKEQAKERDIQAKERERQIKERERLTKERNKDKPSYLSDTLRRVKDAMITSIKRVGDEEEDADLDDRLS